MKKIILLLALFFLSSTFCDESSTGNVGVYVVNKNQYSLREYWAKRFMGSSGNTGSFAVFLKIDGKEFDISDLKSKNPTLTLTDTPSKIGENVSLVVRYDENADGIFEQNVYEVPDFGTHTNPPYSQVKFYDYKSYSITLGPTYNLWTIKEKIGK